MWQGGGMWEDQNEQSGDTFHNVTFSGSGTWQSGEKSGTWSGTAVGSGTSQDDYPGATTGTWKGAGVIVDVQDTAGPSGGSESIGG
jgi:hypothetical protein